MTKKKELNNEDLEQVNGGDNHYCLSYYDFVYDKIAISSNHLNEYLDQEVAVFDDNCSDLVCCGTLREVFEEPNGCTHKKYIKVAVNTSRQHRKEEYEDLGGNLAKICVYDFSIHYIKEYVNNPWK